jgi:outer membrane protein assembly factor BamE (lipoprotein component of BamABCDE complex)
MQKMKGKVWFVVAAVLLLGLTSCGAIYRNHGYIPTPQDLGQIIVGQDTRASVAEKIGQPTTAGVVDDGAWYYVESRFRHFAYQKPKEIEREVLVVSFSASGTVANIERFGLESGQMVTLSRRVTSSSVRDTSFLRQLLGNLGNGAGMFGG